ncbi:hypothetical protein JXA40_00560 [bacterium]|nr:hypothetical protein [candidate division CSSED10-310 bacterium]
MKEDTKSRVSQEQGKEQDPLLEKSILIFLLILILAVLFIPSEWLLKWSMWWNNIK